MLKKDFQKLPPGTARSINEFAAEHQLRFDNFYKFEHICMKCLAMKIESTLENTPTQKDGNHIGIASPKWLWPKKTY